ncbi:GGDEF domain-containing protein [Bacillus atrophaeus]|uniref:Diguanylate cyclase or phosphodiesterase n=1 Tax=Bacillus atrophaeus (strain 1942) TaxID=720555 RepID=A0ABN3Z7G6_BACA1|nr:diguanylate cyclase [Bacillus atrophaeus]AMR63641.1 hypothetical protein A1D11_14930 [Bacillus subtilis subsp. globigii]ADP31388.1 putative diguanylate cyclase or phosphodiesterase [Bacillus atrophaeus 1942]AIK49005.1 diguanylate cyclase domain protein [Bacillus atrophaeus subsp. globigii]EIM09956.1 diguanylate cyclase [Bacillus atrophaeus C89]KFK81861.1 diguanylate cyclase domain protein [Bacillus atrophaeus]
MLKELFVNLTILITFNYLFTFLFKETLIHKEDRLPFQILKGACCGLLGVFLIIFGFTYHHSIIDLRNIPIMIAALYGGWVSTATAFAIIMAGRILISTNASALYSLVTIIIVSVITLLASKRKKPDVLRAFYVLLLVNVVSSVMTYFVLHIHSAALHMYYWLLSSLGGMLSFYLIEHEAKAHLLFKQYKFQANYDFLTGIFNKRKFEEVMHQFYKQAGRSPSFQFALIYLDIDRFKHINDQYGHHEGDQVLKELGARLKLNTRTSDPAARIGGEEFAVLLPNCTHAKAVQVSERIRQAVSGEPIILSSGDKLSVTVSLGTAHYPLNADQPETLPLIADQKLYQAKQTGRNKVCYSTKKE